MIEARPRGDALDREEIWRVVAIVAGVLGLFAAGLGHGGTGVELLPAPGVLGLAARDDSDRTTVERLANQVEAFVDRLEVSDRGTARAMATPTTSEFDLEIDLESESESESASESESPEQGHGQEQDDELERLAAAVDELTSTVERRERRLAESERYRTELYRITSDPSASGDEKIRRVLELGCERLGVEAGFVSRIEPEHDQYTIEFAHGSDLVREAQKSDLSTMYCRNAIDDDDLLGIYNAPAEGYEDDPSYAELGIGCYLGGRIEVNGELYGSLCFVDREPREEPFTSPEWTFVDLATRWVSHELDRRAHERELERQRAFTDEMLDTLDDIFYVVDDDATLLRWNETLLEVTGYSDAEIEAMADEHPYFDEDVMPTIEESIREAFETGETRIEAPLTTTDGERIPHEFVASVLEDPDGNPIEVGIARDISDRKRYERDLERMTNLLERVQRMADIGGWEAEVTGEPQITVWTDELYRLHDHPRDVEPDLETIIECYHPDDRPFVRDRVERAVETETGYDLEGRIRTDAGDIRWVRAMGEPIHEDGDLVAYRGAVQDITSQKKREQDLKSVTETARRLLNATTEPAVAELAAETATELLDAASAGVYLLDSETNRFEPVASAGDFADRTGGAPSVAVGADSLLWNTYVTGTQTVVDNGSSASGAPLFGDDASSGLLVPLGEHGVFVLLAPPTAIDDETRRLFETLVATVEAAFDRLESEASLRERDAELEARNRRLRRQIGITDLIRRIDQSLIGAESRAEIERTVPERLVAADDIAFAWIGAADPGETTLEPRAWAGTSPEYLDAVSLELASGTEPAVRTARTETPTVVENVVDGLQADPWRTTALNEGLQSAVAVPIEFEEYGYGVLAVYADEPDAFTDLERTVFAELGEGIANAINAVQTRAALHSESVVELTLEFSGADDVLSRIAELANARVAYEGLSISSEAESLLFFEVTADDADGSDISDGGASTIRDVLAELVAVTDYRVIAETDDGWLVEATVAGDVLPSRLVRHGASPRSIEADGERTVATADVPPGTDVREFVEMLADRYPSVDLRSRRHVQRDTHTRQELVASLLEPLTERQLEVLRTAYFAGFFEWPRESTGEEVAELLEVTQPTVNRHLRIAQQRLLSQLFETDARPFDGGS